MKNNTAGVLVLFYPDTETLFSNIESYCHDIAHLYVIDNSPCPDPKVFECLSGRENISYLAQNANTGIAAAQNIGARLAILRGYSWILTVDQDSRYSPGELAKLYDFIETHTSLPIGSCSPNIYIAGRPIYPVKESQSYTEATSFISSGSLINLELYSRIGGFDETFFIDYVDIDFCLKSRQQGYLNLCVTVALLHHNLGNTKEIRLFGRSLCITTNHSSLRRYYITRNGLYMFDRYKDIFPDWVEYAKKEFYKNTVKALLFESDKVSKLKSIIHGWSDYKRHLSGIKK